MNTNKPWFDDEVSYFQLNEEDFLLREDEISKVIKFYKDLIDFNVNSYNFRHILSQDFLMDFMAFNYEHEDVMAEYMESILRKFHYIYSIPVVFEYDDFTDIFNYHPYAIAKVYSNVADYNRIFGSMIAIHSGTFFVISDDFSCVCIVKNGHFVIRLHHFKDIYLNNWSKLQSGELEMYDYDKSILMDFSRCCIP